MEGYEKILEKKLTYKRFKHSKNVAEEAVRLANKYGADPKKAQLAGILHDIMKETDKDEQLELLNKYGVKLSELELSEFKLWHAVSGKVYIEKVLNILDKDVLNAVRFHTIARADMSVLEKVVFVADFTSKDRDYDGVDKLRKLADVDLDQTVFEGVKFSLENLLIKRLPIHPSTIEAYNYYLLQDRKGE